MSFGHSRRGTGDSRPARSSRRRSDIPPILKSVPPGRRRPDTTFRGDVVRLVSGTSIGQVIGILAAPILTRLYAPEAFGVAALFVSLTAIVSVLACMRYELAIVLPERDSDAANLLGVSLSFAVGIALLTAIPVWLGGSYLAEALGAPSLEQYLWLIPVAVLIHGAFTALNYWNTRTRQFTRLSSTRVLQTVSVTSGKLGAGFAGHATAGAMIAATVGGQAVATAVLGGLIWRDNGAFLGKSIRWPEMVAGLKRYRKFPIYGSGSILLGVGAWQLPVLMLGIFFPPAVVGLYALGFRILQMPMNLIGSAIGQAFYPRAAQAHIDGTLPQLVESLFGRLMMLGLFPILTLTIVGRSLYSVLFGAEWAEAGVYTQMLSVWALLWFLSGPLTQLFAVLEEQRMQLKWNILNFATRFAAILVGGAYQSPRLAILLLAGAGSLIYAYKIVLTLKLAKVPIRRAVAISMRYFWMFAPAGALLVLLVATGVHDAPIAAAAVGCLTVYYLWIHKRGMLRPRAVGR